MQSVKPSRLSCLVRAGVSIAAGAIALTASAQVPFPGNWPNAPTGAYKQDVFPFAGQCKAGSPGRTCPTTATADFPIVIPPPPAPFGNINPATQAAMRWRFEVPNPVDYTPTNVTDPSGATYQTYEIQWSAVKGVQGLATLGVFPDPTKFLCNGVACPAIPDGFQWTGLADPVTGFPLLTPVWGIGQVSAAGGPLGGAVTWPSMSIRGTKGLPVIVTWDNNLPNNHLFCPYPQAWDWPCAIDRTLMGLKDRTDPAQNLLSPLVPNQVSAYGSPQQPDNAMVVHFHGGEIPPGSDGFAEKWFGNAVTGAMWSPTNNVFLDPMWLAPTKIGPILRPGGPPTQFHGWNKDTYYYPMVNSESLLWFHDHALGKTRINVAAGPAGFFPIEDVCNQVAAGGTCPAQCKGVCSSAYAWLNPLRAAKNFYGAPAFDLFLAIQDRAFNTDTSQWWGTSPAKVASINYPNGLGQTPPFPPPSLYLPVAGTTSVTPGPNPQVHPIAVPEYFADHVTVNGVIWPKATVLPGWYRIRLLDGSNARCYQLGLSSTEPLYAITTGGKVTNDIGFTVIADEQGYLPAPVVIPAGGQITMCPGERYEILVNFGALPAGVTNVWLTNTAPAPFPVGITPQDNKSVFAFMASIVKFTVVPTLNGLGGTPLTAVTNLTIPAVTNPPALFNPPGATTAATLFPICNGTNGPNCVSAVRQLYLNERIDPLTLASLGLQIDGVPFEYSVSETPKQGTFEKWMIINTTGDVHPMHLHLVKFMIVQRQAFSTAGYTKALCGGPGCTIFGGGAGGMKQLVPDVTPFLVNNAPVPPTPQEAGWKDTVQAYPGQVTTVIAKWDGSWTGATAGSCTMNFPGSEAYTNVVYNNALPLCFEPVTNGPYVWHCHIVDHEDAEMMRSSLVIP